MSLMTQYMELVDWIVLIINGLFWLFLALMAYEILKDGR